MWGSAKSAFVLDGFEYWAKVAPRAVTPGGCAGSRLIADG